MSRVSKGKVQYLKSLYQVLNSQRSITDFIVGKLRGGNNRIYLPGSMGKHKHTDVTFNPNFGLIDKVPTLEHGLTRVWDEAHVIDNPDSFSNLNKEFINVRSNWCNELEPKVGFYDECYGVHKPLLVVK